MTSWKWKVTTLDGDTRWVCRACPVQRGWDGVQAVPGAIQVYATAQATTFPTAGELAEHYRTKHPPTTPWTGKPAPNTIADYLDGLDAHDRHA